MRGHRGHRKDGNHNSLRDSLLQLGFRVHETYALGDGAFDLVVARNGHMRWVEVKDPTKPPSKRALTPDELIFLRTWDGYAIVALCVEDVLAQWPT